MGIGENMNIVVHPTYVRGHTFSWVCDNYLVTANGPVSDDIALPKLWLNLGEEHAQWRRGLRCSQQTPASSIRRRSVAAASDPKTICYEARKKPGRSPGLS